MFSKIKEKLKQKFGSAEKNPTQDPLPEKPKKAQLNAPVVQKISIYDGIVKSRPIGIVEEPSCLPFGPTKVLVVE